MSRYRVTVAFRGKLSFDIEADSEQEAEDKGLAAWEACAIPGASDSTEILSLKAAPAVEGKTVRERPAQRAQPERAAAREAVVIETEATPVGESVLEPEIDEPESPTKRPRSIWAYAWTAFWLAVLVVLAQLGSR